MGVLAWIGTGLASAGAAAGAVLAILRLVRMLARANRRFVRVCDAVGELQPNSGQSMKDKLDDVHGRVVRMEGEVADLRQVHRDDTARIWQAIANRPRE